MKKGLIICFIVFIGCSTYVFLNEDYINNETIVDVPTINENSIGYYKFEYSERYYAYQEKHPELSIDDIITRVNIGLDNDFYTNIKKAPNIDTNYVLVNKYNYLEEDYIPNNLEKISEEFSVEGKMLVKEAKINFEKMAKVAKDEGYNIRCISGYRSYNYQSNLYNNYVKKDGVEKADTYSARPGFSEHQTGLAVDIDNTEKSYTDFANTKEFEWMKNNSYKYGFILRYTQNEEITGYTYEPWHYRYVGAEIAAYIHFSNITYDEYYARFVN